MSDILVSVQMITYGHQSFINQAIEGVLMQITNFDYELIIANDCSPDNTEIIVKRIISAHPKGSIIKYYRHDFNIGATANAIFAFLKCKGNYIACCEGDDYWTDPHKLQKQVDFLEANPDYGMVYTNYDRLDENTGKIYKIDCNKGIINGDIYEEYLSSSFIGTLTVMFRRSLVQSYICELEEKIKNWTIGDRPLWLYISSRSKCGLISDYTSVYRRNSNSISSFNNLESEIRFYKMSYEIRFFFINNIRQINNEVLSSVNNSYHRGLLKIYARAKKLKNAEAEYKMIKIPQKSDYHQLMIAKYPLYKYYLRSIRFLKLFGRKYLNTNS